MGNKTKIITKVNPPITLKAGETYYLVIKEDLDQKFYCEGQFRAGCRCDNQCNLCIANE